LATGTGMLRCDSPPMIDEAEDGDWKSVEAVWKRRQRQQHATAAVVPCMAPAVLGRSSPRILAMEAHAPCPMMHYPLISTWSHLAVKLPFPPFADNRHLKAVNLPMLVHPDWCCNVLG